MCDWSERLDAIRADCREKSWDSYRADPVTGKAVATARVLCESLDVVPTNRGGIQIGLAAEGISIVIDPDGRIVGACFDVEDCAEYVDRVKGQGDDQ